MLDPADGSTPPVVVAGIAGGIGLMYATSLLVSV
jgi:hypothetical protein